MPTRKPGERARTDAHGEDVDVAERQSERLQQRQRVAGQPRGERPGAVASGRGHDDAIARQCDAAVAVRGFKSQQKHPGSM